MMNIEAINDLFLSYGYTLLDSKMDEYAVFSLGSSTYPAVEIVVLGGSKATIENLKSNYGKSGYAVHISELQDVAALEAYLFNLFFQVRETNAKIVNRYNDYVRNVMQAYGLPDEAVSSYEYIKIPYSVERDFVQEKPHGDVVSSIMSDLKKPGALLVIVEAGAGFGKTSTAMEIMKNYSDYDADYRPFYMELYKDRTAGNFRYLLLSQIDRSFNVKLGSDLVIQNIKRGRIPLIIDGFDELLSRDIDNGMTEINRQKQETMLSTIAELLTDESKVILTTRKTAIFTGESFIDWYLKSSDNEKNFHVVRYQLESPSVSDWLKASRLKMLPENFDNIVNPVILGYLRYLDDHSFEEQIRDNTIIKTYFDRILWREKDRQDLPFNTDEQMTILRRLAAYLAGLNTLALSRSDIKDTIKGLSGEILERNVSSTKDADQLANTLSNHAFLDRKNESNIGFLNDFIFGTFVMLAIIHEDDSFYDGCFQDIDYACMEKALAAASVQDMPTKANLWNRIQEKMKINDVQVFWSDVILKETPMHCFKGISLDNRIVRGALFGSCDSTIEQCSFSNIEFINCAFDFNSITDCSFINCKFNNCSKEGSNQDCGFYGCSDPENNFIEYFDDSSELIEKEETTDIVIEIMKLYFQVDERTPRMRMISKIKENYDTKTFKKVFSYLEKKGYVKTNGDKSFISTEGIDYYNKNKR